MDYARCPCIQFDADTDPDIETGITPPPGTCMCGHKQHPDHAPTADHSSDWSCKARLTAEGSE